MRFFSFFVVASYQSLFNKLGIIPIRSWHASRFHDVFSFYTQIWTSHIFLSPSFFLSLIYVKYNKWWRWMRWWNDTNINTTCCYLCCNITRLFISPRAVVFVFVDVSDLSLAPSRTPNWLFLMIIIRNRYIHGEGGEIIAEL